MVFSINKLFKNGCDGNNSALSSKTEVQPDIELRVQLLSTPISYTDIPVELREYIAGRGHGEFPCLSPIYSPSSMIPCADFTPWIISQLKMLNITNIKHLSYAILRGSMVSGPSWLEYQNNYNTSIDKVLERHIDPHIVFSIEQAYDELRAALIMVVIHYDWQLLPDEDAIRYLARVMFPYMPSAEEMVVNNGLKKIQKKLQNATLAARCHFFDALSYNDFSKNPRTLESCTFYETRKYGIDTRETTQELFQLGIFERCEEPLIVLSVLTKEQLFEEFQSISNKLRKSWKKTQIIEFLVQNYPSEAQRVANQFNVGIIDEVVENSKEQIKEYIAKVEKYYAACIAKWAK